jgi:hypothetical protein
MYRTERGLFITPEVQNYFYYFIELGRNGEGQCVLVYDQVSNHGDMTRKNDVKYDEQQNDNRQRGEKQAPLTPMATQSMQKKTPDNPHSHHDIQQHIRRRGD